MTERTWIQSKAGETIEQIIDHNTGGKLEEFKHPQFNYYVPNMRTFASWLMAYRDRKIPIHIFGDYDVDGVCSTAEMHLLLMTLGFQNIYVRLPKRLSEGYGMSEKFIDEVSEGVIITVDNGIKAMNAIKKAKQKGLVVMVMDHHQPDKQEGDILLPEADLIVDPHIPKELIQKEQYPEGCQEYQQYCAAGLVFKLAEILLGSGSAFEKIAAMAAIATISDVVDLTGDNRNIYLYGMSCIAGGRMTAGLSTLVRHVQPGLIISEGDIGFKIGPVLNAPGRLYDNGATDSYALLVSENFDAAELQLQSLLLINEERKEIKRKACERAKEQIAKNHMESNNPIIIVDPETPEGIVGLVAGDICEEYSVTTIAFTLKDGNYKGSARAWKEDSIIKVLDEMNATHPEYFASYGGHPGAAGVSIKEEYLESFKRDISNLMGEKPDRDQYLEYDLELKVEDIQETINELKEYAPFGQGNNPPVFLIKNFRLSPKNNVFFQYMGENSIKLFGNGCTAIGFELKDKFSGDYPGVVDIVGTLSENRFLKRVDNQIEIVDIRIPEADRQCNLLDAITQALKSL